MEDEGELTGLEGLPGNNQSVVCEDPFKNDINLQLLRAVLKEVSTL